MSKPAFRPVGDPAPRPIQPPRPDPPPPVANFPPTGKPPWFQDHQNRSACTGFGSLSPSTALQGSSSTRQLPSPPLGRATLSQIRLKGQLSRNRGSFRPTPNLSRLPLQGREGKGTQRKPGGTYQPSGGSPAAPSDLSRGHRYRRAEGGSTIPVLPPPERCDRPDAHLPIHMPLQGQAISMSSASEASWEASRTEGSAADPQRLAGSSVRGRRSAPETGP